MEIWKKEEERLDLQCPTKVKENRGILSVPEKESEKRKKKKNQNFDKNEQKRKYNIW